MTNYEKLCSMSCKELCDFLWDVEHHNFDYSKQPCETCPDGDCTECLLLWLKSEA